jgi:CrcB protein
VGLCGGIGALARFLLDGLISSRAARDFPYGTLAINTSGSLLLGLLTGLALSSNALVLAGGATVGAYTTFSTWMLETHRLAEDGEILAAAVNVLLSLAFGISAAVLGRAIGAHA